MLKYDNPFFSFLNKMINLVFLSILWVIFCIPVFTIGASTSALYYTVQKNIRNGRGYVWTDFWTSFKSDFKQSTIVWLILFAIFVVFAFDASILRFYKNQGKTYGEAYIFFDVLIAVETFYMVIVFSYIARFKNETKEIWKNCIYMIFANLREMIAVAVYTAGAIFLVWLVPVTVFVVPSLAAWLMSYPLEKTYRKYMTEKDKITEDELNRDFSGK